MALSDWYTRELLEELNYVATWLPTTVLAPGSVCDMRDGQLKLLGSLEELGIEAVVESGSAESTIEYKTAGAVSVLTKLEGEAPLPGSALSAAEAGLRITFSREGAILLMLTDCAAHRISNLRAVGEQVLELHNAGDWPRGQVVVTEALTCGHSTIFISSGKNAAIDLVGSASADAGPITIADLNAGLEMRAESDIGIRFLSSPGLTPLVRTSGIVRRMIRDDVFRTANAPDAFGFATVSYDEIMSDD